MRADRENVIGTAYGAIERDERLRHHAHDGAEMPQRRVVGERMDVDVRRNRVCRTSVAHSSDQDEEVDVPTEREEKLDERAIDAEAVGVVSIRDFEVRGEPTRHADGLIAVASHGHMVLAPPVRPSRCSCPEEPRERSGNLWTA